jgi:hypothetical protein
MLRGFLTATLIVFVFLLFFRWLSMGDIWWHLSVGRWIADHHQIPVQDPFPFSGERTTWLHTQWLGSFAFYETYRWLGIEGLRFLRAGYFLFVIGIFYVHFFRRVPHVLLLSITVLLSYGLFIRNDLKPDIANFFFIQVLLILLMSFERSGNRRLLYFLPFLGALWFNIHIGALVYGTAVIAAFGLSSLIGLGQLKGTRHAVTDIHEQGRRTITLGLALLGFLVSFLLTPLGWDGLLFQLKVFFPSSDPRLFYSTLQNIPESMPPQLFDWGLSWFWGLLALDVLFLGLQRRIVLSRVLLFLVSLAMFFYMHRNGAFFALVSGYIIADAAGNMDWERRGEMFTWRKPLGAVLLLAFVVVVFLQIREAYRKVAVGDSVRRFAFVDVQGSQLVDGVNFLKKHRLSGRILNPIFRHGGYILWEAYPDLRPFMDGRNINFGRYLETQDVRRDPERLWPSFEKKYPMDIIMTYVGPETVEFARYINKAPDWQLIYVEGWQVIFVKRGKFSLPEDIDAYQDRLRAQKVSPADIKELENRCSQRKTRGLKEWIDPPPLFVTGGLSGMTLLSLGYEKAGLQEIIAASKQDHGTVDEELATALAQLTKRSHVRF